MIQKSMEENLKKFEAAILLSVWTTCFYSDDLQKREKLEFSRGNKSFDCLSN